MGLSGLRECPFSLFKKAHLVNEDNWLEFSVDQFDGI